MKVALRAPRAVVSQPKVGFWDQPLGYRHATLSVVAALAIGCVMHVAVGYGAREATLPLLLLGAVPVLSVGLATRMARHSRVLHWLTGIPMAVCTTAAVSVMALAGGFFTQADIQRLGAPSMWGSWPFLMTMMLLMVNLVGSTIKRCWPITVPNVRYFLTHGGLAIAMAGGAFGAATLERQRMVLYEGQPTALAFDEHGHEIPAPFQATLREFTMETFEPTLVLAVRDDQAEGGMRIEPGSEFVELGMTEQIGDAKVEVTKFLSGAVFNGETWVEVPWKTAAPVAWVKASLADGTSKEGWVSCGSIESPGVLLELPCERAIAMPDPRPKRFASRVEFKGTGEKLVEVNAPARVAGYDVYQLSYDEQLGAASPYSVVELVRDRSLPAVYTGMILLLLGVMMHMWTGAGDKR